MISGGNLIPAAVLDICEIIMEKNLFDTLYREYFPMVYWRCFEYLRNHEDAEDAANSVFERFFKKDDIDYPKSYLYRMATNMGIDRKRNRRKEVQLFYVSAANVSLNCIKKKEESELKKIFRKNDAQKTGSEENLFFDKQFEKIEADLLISALFNETDEMTRDIYFFRHFNEMTYKEIGKVFGLGKSAVEKRIKKAQKDLRIKIDKDKK